MEIPLPGSAVSGSRYIKQIYTAPDCHKRHAACRGARHRDRAFAAVKRHTRNRRIVFIILRRQWKRGEKQTEGGGGEKEVRSRERATWRSARRRDLILIPGDEGSPRRRRRVRVGHGEVKRLLARGLTDKHNDLMTISYANDTKFYDRGA